MIKELGLKNKYEKEITIEGSKITSGIIPYFKSVKKITIRAENIKIMNPKS
jgi:hypothetical protein